MMVALHLAKLISNVPPFTLTAESFARSKEQEKYVGGNPKENDLQKFLKNAAQDYKQKGNASSIHVLIMDGIGLMLKRDDLAAEIQTMIIRLCDWKIDSPSNILLIGLATEKSLPLEELCNDGKLDVKIEFVSIIFTLHFL
jgi:vesicle-fusing ATPase